MKHQTLGGGDGYVYHPPTTSPLYRHAVSPMCDVICRYLLPGWLHPNVISVIGLVLAVAACIAAEMDAWKYAAWLWVGYSICDNLDGKQARHRQLSSASGEYLDHVVDSVTSSLLALILVAVLLPACHHQSLFNPWDLQPHFFNRDIISYMPLVVLVGMAQIPFYIGTWAHHKTGRLILGCRYSENARDIFTVDEVNLLLIPALCYARTRWPSFATETLFSMRSSVPLLGIDCQSETWNSIYSFSAASLVVVLFMIFVFGSSIRLAFKLFEFRSLHYPIALTVYVLTAFLVPIPPILLIPVFSWMNSCLIFSKSTANYRKQDLETTRTYPWQIQKRYPLLMHVCMALGLRYIALTMDVVYARHVTFFLTGALSTLFVFVANADMGWLVENESLRTNLARQDKQHFF